MTYSIRKAVLADSESIQKLVKQNAQEGKMLHRSLQYIYEHIRDYYVAPNQDGDIIGACAFTISQKDLAEVKSLTVDKKFQKLGIASKLISAGLEDLQKLGIIKAFCLTYVPDFFAKLGFSIVTKESLPHKIWTECINCPQFPDCDEIAMVKDLSN